MLTQTWRPTWKTHYRYTWLYEYIDWLAYDSDDDDGSRTLSILYSGSVRTISIPKAERVCGARHN